MIELNCSQVCFKFRLSYLFKISFWRACVNYAAFLFNVSSCYFHIVIFL